MLTQLSISLKPLEQYDSIVQKGLRRPTLRREEDASRAAGDEISSLAYTATEIPCQYHDTLKLVTAILSSCHIPTLYFEKNNILNKIHAQSW